MVAPPARLTPDYLEVEGVVSPPSPGVPSFQLWRGRDWHFRCDLRQALRLVATTRMSEHVAIPAAQTLVMGVEAALDAG